MQTGGKRREVKREMHTASISSAQYDNTGRGEGKKNAQAGGRGRKMHTVDIYFAQYDHAGRREGEKCATRTQPMWVVSMVQSVTVNDL